MNNKHYVGRQVSSHEWYDEIGPITGVALLLDNNNEELKEIDETAQLYMINNDHDYDDMNGGENNEQHRVARKENQRKRKDVTGRNTIQSERSRKTDCKSRTEHGRVKTVLQNNKA